MSSVGDGKFRGECRE